MKQGFAVFLLICCFSCTKKEDITDLNFGFESREMDSVNHWTLGAMSSGAYSYTIDTETSNFGHNSLKIKATQENPGLGIVAQKIPVHFSGHQIVLKAFVKTMGVEAAGIWLRIDAETRLSVAFENTALTNPLKGSHDWTAIEISLPFSQFADAGSATEVHFGAMLSGEGQIWIDDFELTIDDTPIAELLLQEPPSVSTPSQADIDYLRNNLIELTDLTSEGLKGLKSPLEHARLVALGEATHGTKEFFQIKTELIKTLITESGYNTIMLEDGVQVVDLINDYIGDSETDLNEVMGKLYPIWQTPEMKDLIEWARVFNNNHERQIEFIGFDIQSPELSIDHMLQSTSKIPDRHGKAMVDSLVAGYKDIYRLSEKNRQVLSQKLLARLDTLTKCCSNTDKESPKHLALLRQFFHRFTTRETYLRDSMMAGNIIAYHDEHPDSKTIVWAHNYHISKEDRERMGYYLKHYFRNNYLSIALTTNSGEFAPSSFKSVTPIQEASQGSLEYLLDMASPDIFFLGFAPTQRNDKMPSFNAPIKVRSIGGVSNAGQFITSAPVNKAYDGFIYIRRTEPSKKLDDQQK